MYINFIYRWSVISARIYLITYTGQEVYTLLLLARPQAHSQLFNVAHRKTGGPGTRSHVWRVMMIDCDVA